LLKEVKNPTINIVIAIVADVLKNVINVKWKNKQTIDIIIVEKIDKIVTVSKVLYSLFKPFGLFAVNTADIKKQLKNQIILMQ
jgi:hypothetical protein